MTLEWCKNEIENELFCLVPIYTLSIMVCHMNDIGMALECEWEWAPMSCSLIYTFLNLIPDEWHKNGVRMRLRMSSSVLFPIYTLSTMVSHTNDIGMMSEWKWKWTHMSCSSIYPLQNLIPDKWHKNGVRMRMRMSSFVLFPYIYSPLFNPIQMTSELH